MLSSASIVSLLLDEVMIAAVDAVAVVGMIEGVHARSMMTVLVEGCEGIVGG